MIYMDNAATTSMCPAAISAMLPFFDTAYGNPSSLHSAGQQARTALAEARAKLAACLGCSPEEIICTSGGSEADNQALRTAAYIGKRKGLTHILSTPTEHHAILHTLEALKKEGFDIELLPVDSEGLVSPEQVARALRPDTALVTLMYANNEIGTIHPIPEIAALCHERNVLFHTDAVQAAGHLPIQVKEQHIDMLSLSAHKFRGPKGIGLLYARKGLPMAHLIEGGGQEGGRRAGTENVASIIGMAAALEEACLHQAENAVYVRGLRDRMIEEISRIPHCVLNGHKTRRLPGNVNFCFEGVSGELLLLELDKRGICCSSGSACTASSADPSHVLRAIGRPNELANGSLRISLNETNTEEEVSYVLTELPLIIENLRSHSPIWKMKTEGTLPYLT